MRSNITEEFVSRQNKVEMKRTDLFKTEGLSARLSGDSLDKTDPWMKVALEEQLHRKMLEKREEALLEELSTSWECLQAVYEIGKTSDFECTTTDLLELITQQIRNLHPELKVVVWNLDQEHFLPVTANGVCLDLFQPLSKDLFHELIQNNRPLIEARFEGKVDLPVSLMLDRASSFALLPISNTDEQFGLLQVWTESDRPEFNSPLIRFLEALASHVSLNLDQKRMRQEWLAGEKIKHQLSIGSEIQQKLLLSSPPKHISGLQLALVSLPSRQIDGDFVDFAQDGESRLDLVVGDVMGKGVPAALLATAIKEEFQRARGKLVSYSEPAPRPEAITNEAHRRLGTQLEDLETFATACFARIDVPSHTLTLVDCGHPKTLHWRDQEGICQKIEGDNLPLGFRLHEVYRQISVSFQPNDVFLFYSDGVTDARTASGEYFGEKRLEDLLEQNHHLQPPEIIGKIQQELTEFSGSQLFDDDFTCVVVKIEDSPYLCPLVRIEEELSSDITQLGRIRELVKRVFGPTESIPELTRHHLEIGLTEALSNVIRHSYHQNPDYPITIRGENSGSRVLFRIYHWGDSFIPRDEPKLDLSRESGFGRYLISKTFDQTIYSTDEYGRTCIRLEKHLKGNTHEEVK